jgi:hypothetical protein
MSTSIILFYSPECEYSVQVMRMIDAFRIRDQFIIVNISNPEYKLPSFVDRVPLIFIKGQNQIVIDDNIPQFLETLKGNTGQQQQQQQQQQSQVQQTTANPDDMLSMSDISRGFSDNFSFIDDGTGPSASIAPKNFVFIDNAGSAGGNGRMPDPQDASKANKFDSQGLERFTSQRNLDDELFKKQNPR